MLIPLACCAVSCAYCSSETPSIGAIRSPACEVLWAICSWLARCLALSCAPWTFGSVARIP
jgi:hypothetical protein